MSVFHDNTKKIIFIFVSLLFLPIFSGNILVGGTDVIYGHFPNLLFGYDQWVETGRLALWNPYNFAGMDMTSSLHSRHLNFIYWPLFLLDRDNLLYGVTALSFSSAIVVAYSWYGLAKKYGHGALTALIVSMVASGGTFFWFATTTLIAVSMYAASSLSLYLIFTSERRSRAVQFFSLSVLFTVIFITSHPAYIFGFGLPIVASFLFLECRSIRQNRKNLQIIPVILAGLVGLALASYRLLPTISLLAEEVTKFEYATYKETYEFLLLTFFNPQLFGANIGENGFIQSGLGEGVRHMQIHTSLYFGLISTFLIVASFAVKTQSYWSVFFLVSSILLVNANVFGFGVLSELMHILFYPFKHTATFRILSNFSFLALLVCCLNFSARELVQNISRVEKRIILMVAIVAILHIVYWRRIVHEIPLLTSMDLANEVGWDPNAGILYWLVRGGILAIIILSWLVISKPQIFEKLHPLKLAISGILIAALIPFLAILLHTDPDRYQWPTMGWYLFSNLAALILMLCAFLLHFQARSTKANSTKWVVWFPRVICLVALLLVVNRFSDSLRGTPSVLLYSFAGLTYFVAAAVIFLFFLKKLKQKGSRLEPVFLLPLALICSIDLLGAYRNYSYSNAPKPFVRSLQSLYPHSPANIVYPNVENSAYDNLFTDPEFKTVGKETSAWRLGGKDISLCAPTGARDWSNGDAIAVCNKGIGDGTIFQDVLINDPDATAVFGVWVRSSGNSPVKSFVTSPTANLGGPNTAVPADGRWHWLTSKLPIGEPGHIVRPHIVVGSGQRIEVYAPTMVINESAIPTDFPLESDFEDPKKDFPPFEPDQYRLNFIHRVASSFNSEIMSNFASVFKLRTYGGVDSYMPAEFERFLATFEKLSPDWFHRAGFTADRTNDRLLDLFGVKYSLDDSGQPLYRDGAVPRIAAFSGHEIVSDLDHALSRVAEESFSPLLSVVIENKPNSSMNQSVPVKVASDKAQPLEYREDGTEQIFVKVPSDVGRMIFFGDRFNTNWKAYWNKKEIPVHRANGAFMAVNIPDGGGELLFKFDSALFARGIKISQSGLVMLLLFTVVLFSRDRRRERSSLASHLGKSYD